MKLKSIFLLTIILSGLSIANLYAQKTITYSFNSSSTIDSIKIENLSNHTRRTIYTNNLTLPLDVINGIGSISLSRQLITYPNPCDRQATIEYTSDGNKMVHISISDLSGKIVAQTNNKVSQGLQRFIFNPGKSGIYLLKLSDATTVYSTKVVCHTTMPGTPAITLQEAIPSINNKPSRIKTSVNSLPDLKLVTGNKLLFTAYHNSKTKLVYDFVKSNKDYSFNFIDNIWEYIASDSQLDSLRTYLYSYNKTFLDTDRSTPYDIDELGQTMYSDTVNYTINYLWTKLGAFNNEDSSYFAILPTNSAWNKAYAKIYPNFRYYPGKSTAPSYATNKYIADTLQRNNTCLAITSNLYSTKKSMAFPTDSVISTSGNILHNPTELIAGATQKEASNGLMFLTDSLRLNPQETWSKKINVEAENPSGRTHSFISTVLSERSYSGEYFSNQVSDNKYLKLSPVGPSSAPSVTFEIANTLAGKLNADSTIAYGTAYNVYAVFLPDTIESGSYALPSKVRFELSYMNDGVKKNLNGQSCSSDGAIQTELYGSSTSSFFISKSRITKVLVAKKVTFPYCEFGKLNSMAINSNVNATLKVVCTTAPIEVNNKLFTKNIYIDRIILEPVQ